MTGRILIVDDDRSMCEMLQEDLSRRGLEAEFETEAERAYDRFLTEIFDTVITDLRMPGLDGIDFCKRLVDTRPEIPVVVITAFGSLETAISAIRAGAYDFVTKPIELDMLGIVIDRALNHRSLQQQVKLLEDSTGGSHGFDEILGESDVMLRLFDQIERVASQPIPVLITGESGTGKDLVAQALHRRSPRRDKPFVPVNCAALPENLLESELFGHARGAFTDARTERKGLFLEANGGTVFLDEIGEISMRLQPTLLRALESGSVRPVGADKEVQFDVRLITATNRNLDTMVEQKEFREDLFFRINVVQLDVPPLRTRGSDILFLARHFLREAAQANDRPVQGFSPKVAERLLHYSWPGNVRELRNAIQRAVALARFDELTVEDLPEPIREYDYARATFTGAPGGQLLPLEVVERQYIQHVLDTVGGNKSVAARVLGLDRRTLYRKLERWDTES